MIKRLAENYIRRSKSKDFSFDEKLTSSVLFEFICEKFWAYVKGLKVFNAKKRGKFLFFGRKVKLFNKRNIYFGNNVVIGDFVKLSGFGEGKLQLGNNVNIGSFSQLIISTSFNNIGKYIEIGDNVGIGEYAYIGGGGGTKIRSNTIVGQYLSIHPENHNYSNSEILIREQGVSRKGIDIGENCWIGSKVTILDGVKIGDNSVIAAGSVITKSFPSNSMIGGVPAKLIKSI